MNAKIHYLSEVARGVVHQGRGVYTRITVARDGNGWLSVQASSYGLTVRTIVEVRLAYTGVPGIRRNGHTMISCEGRNRRTVNLLKTIYFDSPEWTICSVSLMNATWMKYREELEQVVLAHPRVFPGRTKGLRDFDEVADVLYEAGEHTDCWGTVWNNVARGLSSHPVRFPLENWEDFEAYVAPDPMKEDTFGPRGDWGDVARRLARSKAGGGVATGGGLQHGFMYMRLFYLRRFENLMMDMITGDPRLPRLIRMVEDYNAAVIGKHLELGAEYMTFGDDLGLQDSLPMSPALWRTYIKPSYDRLLRPCREADVPVYLHTDGHVLEIIPDLIEAGVRVLNPQIRANGLEGLQAMAKGKMAINLDLDRQLFPFATPSEIEDHIGEMYEGLHLPEGGLMLHAECEPDVPLDNIDTICTVLERICRPPEPDA